MEMRSLRESDHAAVVPVVDAWWGGRRVGDKLPRLFFRYFAGTGFAIEEDGEIIAFLVGIVGSPPEESYVHFVGVRPDRRCRGLGRRLYEAFFERARSRGCRSVRAITSPVNKSSIAYHAKMGFSVVPGDGWADGVSVHENYDGDGEGKVVFRRDLF